MGAEIVFGGPCQCPNLSLYKKLKTGYLTFSYSEVFRDRDFKFCLLPNSLVEFVHINFCPASLSGTPFFTYPFFAISAEISHLYVYRAGNNFGFLSFNRFY